MSKLILELKQEHKKILDILYKVKALGIGKTEAQELLVSAKQLLLIHLEKEDERLYPALRKEAKTNFELKRTLDNFAKDMELTTLAAMAFFDKYEKGGTGYEFTKDYELLSSNISERIRNEESQIYSEYSRLFSE